MEAYCGMKLDLVTGNREKVKVPTTLQLREVFKDWRKANAMPPFSKNG